MVSMTMMTDRYPNGIAYTLQHITSSFFQLSFFFFFEFILRRLSFLQRFVHYCRATLEETGIGGVEGKKKGERERDRETSKRGVPCHLPYAICNMRCQGPIDDTQAVASEVSFLSFSFFRSGDRCKRRAMKGSRGGKAAFFFLFWMCFCVCLCVCVCMCVHI